MKKALIILGAIAFLVFASSAVWATISTTPTVKFIEPIAEDQPVCVETYNIAFPITKSGVEWGFASGLVGELPGYFKIYGAMLTEPGCPDKASDVAFLVTTDIGSKELFASAFFSDGFKVEKEVCKVGTFTLLDFEDVVCAFNKLPACDRFTYPETGCLQDLFCFDNLKVQAKSDAAVPLPGAVLLLGAGLARLTAYARRKRD